MFIVSLYANYQLRESVEVAADHQVQALVRHWQAQHAGKRGVSYRVREADRTGPPKADEIEDLNTPYKQRAWRSSYAPEDAPEHVYRHPDRKV